MVTTVLMAKPRGFCAGVARAIDIVDKALEIYGAPVYVKHAIVHNIHVIKDLEKKGAIFVEEISEIPEGSTTVFSAHGSPPQVFEEAKKKHLKVIDAACPLVNKVHLEAKLYSQKGYAIVYVGHKGHPEGIGVKGEVDTVGGEYYLIDNISDALAIDLGEKPVALLTQTTLSLDDTKEIMAVLHKKFVHALLPPNKDICYATENRQQAIKEIAKRAQVILVLGSKTSSNSNRLKEVAQTQGAQAYLIDDISFIDQDWFQGVTTVGISAGASAPERLVEEVKEYFTQQGATTIEEVEFIKEDIFFPLPKEVRASQVAA